MQFNKTTCGFSLSGFTDLQPQLNSRLAAVNVQNAESSGIQLGPFTHFRLLSNWCFRNIIHLKLFIVVF